MQLSLFIVARLDTIVEEWQTFGRPLAPSLCRSETTELRDCLKGVLLAIAGEMDRDGAGAQRQRQALGDEPGGESLPSIRHGRLRQKHGIGVGQLVEEFGLLRTAVLARWYFSGARKDSESVLNQGRRFNQAVDAALRDSAEGFTQALTATRDAYLFTLAQDLRHPLSTIQIASAVLARPDFGPETRRNANRRVRAALTQMDGSISDLLEYTRRRRVPGIPVDQLSCDLRHVCEAAIATVRTNRASRTFHLAMAGDLVVCADAPRIQQALLNLLHNALQHGDEQSVIKLDARADGAGASLSVWNAGSPIPAASMEAIFKPWIRIPMQADARVDRPSANLGLGLFIAREIAVAHGGNIKATSHAIEGTRFTIWLPRYQAGPAAGTSSARVDATRVSQHAN